MTPTSRVTPICAQCGTPMSLERIEPHTKLPASLRKPSGVICAGSWNEDNVYMLKMRLELTDEFEVLVAEDARKDARWRHLNGRI